jgi:hypothetical protein
METIIEQLKTDWKQYLQIDDVENGYKIRPPQNYAEDFLKFIQTWIDDKEFDKLIFAESRCGLPTYYLLYAKPEKGDLQKLKYWTI